MTTPPPTKISEQWIEMGEAREAPSDDLETAPEGSV